MGTAEGALSMNKLRHTLTLALTGGLLVAAACSPEADRARGGGRGADTGNRPGDSAEVEIHGETDPSHDVPTVGQGIKKERGR